MTAIWTTHISESKWRRVRRELEDNGLVLPFTGGVTQNRKTGYILKNRYDRNSSQLEITITYAAILNRPFESEGHIAALEVLLVGLFDSRGKLTI